MHDLLFIGQIIAAIIIIILGTIPGIMSYLKGKDNANKLEELHILFNSRFDQIMKLAVEAAYAKGKLSGAAEERETTKKILDSKNETQTN